MNDYSFVISEKDAGRRIDSYLSDEIDEASRSFIQKCVKESLVFVNGKNVKPNYRLKCSDVLGVDLPKSKEPDIIPEDITLEILYEDDDILVVNKPKNMVVHPSAGHTSGTLVNALMYYCGDSLSGINGILRPGIVHRIDKDTTGALVVCKNDKAHTDLASQLAVHSVTRKYRAILHGYLPCDKITLKTTIGRHHKNRKKMAVGVNGGKEAITDIEVLKRLNNYSYVECTLHTGRTHQIRVQTADIGHPVLGDELYGPAKCPVSGLQGQCLHAYMIGFVHPIQNKYMEVYAPIPDYFENTLRKLSF